MNYFKRNMRYILLLLSLIILISCEKKEQRKSDILEFIAPSAGVILQINHFEDWKNVLDKQSFLKKNNSVSLLEFLNFNTWESIIDMPEKSLITYHTLGKSEHAETLIFKQKDSLTLKVQSSETIVYDGEEVMRLENGNTSFFYSKLSDHYVFSTSKIILENIIRNYKNDIEIPSSITKLANVLSDSSSSVIINTNLLEAISKETFTDLSFMPFLDMSDHVGFDLNLTENEIFLSGIVLKSERQDFSWTSFENVKQTESIISEVIPNNFVKAKTILISDYKKLFALDKSVNNAVNSDSLWLGVSEIAQIDFTNTSAHAMVAKDIDETFDYLNRRSKPLTSFGSFDVFQLTTKLQNDQNLSQYFDDLSFEYFTIHNDIILASNRLQTIEDMIIELNNGNVISNQSNFKYHMDFLNAKSHILWFTNLSKLESILDEKLSKKKKKDFKKINWSKHEFLISQMNVEDGFAYFNILQRKTKEQASGAKVEQVVRIKSEDGILSAPQFFKNWRTGQYDIVYQDNSNVLYLKDTKGNLIWSKQLDSPIVGKITSIDIYQNKRIQLAFATQNRVYVLDKNGKDVAPFPIRSKDEITQELSVFDYDKNGTYRFVVVNNKRITMYDKQAKKVKGFKYKKAKTFIKYPVEHIRMGGKDYIIVQDDSGHFEILNRRGKLRVKLDKNFEHNGSKWYIHKGKFVSLSAEGKLVFIDSKGGIDVKEKNWINPKFTADLNTLVNMSENILSIDDFEAELPYGLYSNPIITNNYVSIADGQEQKIYLFNKKAELLNGFPIYGKKVTDLYYSRKQIVLLCLDENDAFMVYQVDLQ